jgi:hypothetical protein
VQDTYGALAGLKRRICASILPVALLHCPSDLSASTKALLTSLVIDVTALTLLHVTSQHPDEVITPAFLSAALHKTLPAALAEACLREGEQAVLAFTASLPAVALAKRAAAAANAARMTAAASAAHTGAAAAGGWGAWQARRQAKLSRQAYWVELRRIACPTTRAALTFKVDTVEELVGHCAGDCKLAEGASCLLAGVLQCLLGAVLKGVGARPEKSPLVRTRHILGVMRGNADLCQLVPPAEAPSPA